MKQTIRIFAVAIAVIFSAHAASAQKDKSKRPSPPAQVTKTINGAEVTIDYSQPSKKGREVFGKLVPWGKVWRTGANENTWIEISKDVKVEGNTLAAGKYGLHTIPGADEWVIIFNSVSNAWGSYDYDKSKDVLRVPGKVMKGEMTEKFTIDISDSGDVSLAWDTTKVVFSIK